MRESRANMAGRAPRQRGPSSLDLIQRTREQRAATTRRTCGVPADPAGRWAPALVVAWARAQHRPATGHRAAPTAPGGHESHPRSVGSAGRAHPPASHVPLDVAQRRYSRRTGTSRSWSRVAPATPDRPLSDPPLRCCLDAVPSGDALACALCADGRRASRYRRPNSMRAPLAGQLQRPGNALAISAYAFGPVQCESRILCTS
jgi:hypothetical protein